MLYLTKDSFSDKQKEAIRNSNKRINLFCGAVRSGKTIASIFKWIIYMLEGPAGDLLMIGKTERTIRRNIINPLSKIIGSSFRYNQGLAEVHMGNRTIYIAGANDERSEGKIRGMTVAGIYGDEITLWPKSFFNMALSRMSIANAQFIGTTNTDTPYHWLKTDFIDRNDLDLYNIDFKLEDNIYLDKVYIDNIKKEYTGLWYQRFIEGMWVLADGVIYSVWDPINHIYDTITEKIDTYKYIVAVDYGITNPTVFGLFKIVNNKNVYLEREMYLDSNNLGPEITDTILCSKFDEFMKEIRSVNVYVDPSATSFINILKRREKWKIIPANNDVSPGIQLVSSYLSNNNFKVNKDCKNSIKGFGTYCWDPKAQLRGDDKPLKINDHTSDMIRYALYSEFGNKNIKGVVNNGNIMNSLFGR